MHRAQPRRLGFTMIELMIVIAVVAIIATLAAPSFMDMIVMQRLRGVNAQLVTDLQFGRSEAVARGRYMRFNFGSDANQTCYVIYVNENGASDRCDCTAGAGAACTAVNTLEVKTVSVARNSQVSFVMPVGQDTAFAYDYVTGGLVTIPSDSAIHLPLTVQISSFVDNDRQLQTNVLQTGRPSVCAPNPSRMQVTGC